MSLVVRDLLDERRQIFDYQGGNQIIYLGKAGPGSMKSDYVWQIRKFSYTGQLVSEINFANGTKDFDKVWDDRTTYDYDQDS
jgi:hypothetical protein